MAKLEAKNRGADLKTGTFKSGSLLRSKLFWTILVVIVAVVVAAVYFGGTKNSNKAQAKCSDSLLKSANLAMQNESYVAKLRPIANNIQKIDGFDQDVNCLYYVTVYYISIGDSKNAQRYQADLTKLYTSSKDLSKIIKDPQSIQSLKDKTRFLNEQANDAKLQYGGPTR